MTQKLDKASNHIEIAKIKISEETGKIKLRLRSIPNTTTRVMYNVKKGGLEVWQEFDNPHL